MAAEDDVDPIELERKLRQSLREPTEGPRRRPARKSRRKQLAPPGETEAYSIEQFCARNGLSVQMFYKRPDLMPDTFSIGTRRLISREAASRWRAEREAESKAKTEPA
jgi:hypothetical protein